MKELLRGPGNERPPQTNQPWTILSAKTEGVTPGFVIRDSAGVRLVEHPAAVLELPTLELSASVLQIGDMDGDGPGVFGSIAGVGRLSDCAIAPHHDLEDDLSLDTLSSCRPNLVRSACSTLCGRRGGGLRRYTGRRLGRIALLHL